MFKLHLLGGTAIAGLALGLTPFAAQALPAACTATPGPAPVITCPTGDYTEQVEWTAPDSTVIIGAGSTFDVPGMVPILIHPGGDYAAPANFAAIVLGDENSAPIMITLTGDSIVGAGIDADWVDAPSTSISGHAFVTGGGEFQGGFKLYNLGDGVIDVVGGVHLTGPATRALEVSAYDGSVDINFRGDIVLDGAGSVGVFANRVGLDLVTFEHVDASIDVNIDGDLFVSSEAQNALDDYPEKQPIYGGSSAIEIGNGSGGANVAFGNIYMTPPEDAAPGSVVGATGLKIATTGGDVVVDGGNITVESNTAFGVNIGEGVRQDAYSMYGEGTIDLSLGNVIVEGNDSQGAWLRADQINASFGNIYLQGDQTISSLSPMTALMLGIGTSDTNSEVSFADMMVSGSDALGVAIREITMGTEIGADLEFGSITMAGPHNTAAISLGAPDDFSTASEAWLTATGNINVMGFESAGALLHSDGGIHFAYLGGVMTINDFSAGIHAESMSHAEIINRGSIGVGTGSTGIFASTAFGDADVYNSGFVYGIDGEHAILAESILADAFVHNEAEGEIAGSIVSVGGTFGSVWNEGLWSIAGDSQIGDLLENDGVIALNAPGAASIFSPFGSFQFDNYGIVSLANGETGDELNIYGDYFGCSCASVTLDVNFDGAASSGDMFWIEGDATGQTIVDVVPTFAGTLASDGDFVALIDTGSAAADTFVAYEPVIADGITDWSWTQLGGIYGYSAAQNVDRAAAAGRFGVISSALLQTLKPIDLGSGGSFGSGSTVLLAYDEPASSPPFPLAEKSGGISLHGRMIGGNVSNTASDDADFFGMIGGVDMLRGSGPDASGYGVFGGGSTSNLRMAGGVTAVLKAAGIGARARFANEGWFAQIAGQAGGAWLDASIGGATGSTSGTYGVIEAEIGKRFGGEVYFEPAAFLSASVLDLGAFSVGGAAIDADSTSLTAGGTLKVGTVRQLASGWKLDAFALGGVHYTSASGTDLVGTTAVTDGSSGTTGRAGVGVTLTRPDGGMSFTAGVDGRFGAQNGVTAGVELSVKFGG